MRGRISQSQAESFNREDYESSPVHERPQRPAQREMRGNHARDRILKRGKPSYERDRRKESQTTISRNSTDNPISTRPRKKTKSSKQAFREARKIIRQRQKKRKEEAEKATLNAIAFPANAPPPKLFNVPRELREQGLKETGRKERGQVHWSFDPSLPTPIDKHRRIVNKTNTIQRWGAEKKAPTWEERMAYLRAHSEPSPIQGADSPSLQLEHGHSRRQTWDNSSDRHAVGQENNLQRQSRSLNESQRTMKHQEFNRDLREHRAPSRPVGHDHDVQRVFEHTEHFDDDAGGIYRSHTPIDDSPVPSTKKMSQPSEWPSFGGRRYATLAAGAFEQKSHSSSRKYHDHKFRTATHQFQYQVRPGAQRRFRPESARDLTLRDLTPRGPRGNIQSTAAEPLPPSAQSVPQKSGWRTSALMAEYQALAEVDPLAKFYGK